MPTFGSLSGQSGTTSFGQLSGNPGSGFGNQGGLGSSGTSMYVNHINPFKAIVCHYIETTTLICDKNKFFSFYMIRDIDLK